jgi:hypothetical protein
MNLSTLSVIEHELHQPACEQRKHRIQAAVGFEAKRIADNQNGINKILDANAAAEDVLRGIFRVSSGASATVNSGLNKKATFAFSMYFG